MSRKLVFAVYLFVFLSSPVLYVRFTHVEVKAPNGFPVHNIDTGFNYTSIQGAIDAPETGDGHTIFVEAGVYYEHVVVDKLLTLVGENVRTTIVNGNETGIIFNVTRNNVNITGFTIQNSGSAYPDSGIYLSNVIHCSISENNIENNYDGIWLSSSSNNSLSGNNIANNGDGIYLSSSSNNNLSGNNITANNYEGIWLAYSSNNSLSGNNITNNGQGIYLGDSSSNSMSGNNIIANNYDGIMLSESSNNKISGNNVTENYNGIYLEISSNNIICRNKVTASQYSGILLSESHCNMLSENNVTDNSRIRGGSGIGLWSSSRNIIYQNNITANEWWGINPADSNNNTICRNNIKDNNVGINFATANANTIYGNNITENEFSGIYLESSSNNKFYHNNFFNNTNQVTIDTGNGYTPNSWDNGVEGNYWSDYVDVDVNSGGDGLGDNPYVIDLNNTDNHPLMAPISFFDAGTWDEITYYVHTVSNSTISDFDFNVNSQVVSFNITGLDGTPGFCRIAIPRELLWCEDIFDWTVRVNGTSVPIRIQEYTEYTYLYFTYNHSIQPVEIYGTQAIPEFPSSLILPLFMMATLVAVAVYRRKEALRV